MKIHEASLCLRFYTADGWTRNDVVMLLSLPIPRMLGVPIHFVCPRWFDNEEKDRKYAGYLYKTSEQHLDCDYYAMYHPSISFDEEGLKQHDIVPFGNIPFGSGTGDWQ